MASENPELYWFMGSLNLLILLVIIIGFIVDIVFMKRIIRKEPLNIRLIEPELARWGIPDIVRVILIFLSSGYVFAILEGVAMKSMPIFSNENFRMVFNTAIMNTIAIAVILHFVVRRYGHDLSAIGLSPKNGVKGLYYGIVGYVALIPVLIAFMVITFFVVKLMKYQPPVQPIVQVFVEEKNASVLLLSTLFASIFGPIAEEIFFRGFVYTAIKKKTGIITGMIITSVIFSMLHAHAVGFFPIMALGLLLAYLYEKTGSLIAPMAVHIIHNVGMVVLLFFARSVG